MINKNKQLSDDYVVKELRNIPLNNNKWLNTTFRHQKDNLRVD